MNVLGVIPARYASSRFPGKPLIDLDGKTMLQRVYEQCMLSKSLTKILIATDDQRIYDHAKSINANVCMTSDMHPSGTDRCAEAAMLSDFDADVIVNIQGDEPLIQPEQIDLLVDCFKDPKTDIASLVKKIEHVDALHNPNTPKVVMNDQGFAMYFSREAIPHIRSVEKNEWLQHHTYYQHIGIYAYKKSILQSITKLPISSLEKAEALEQLRWLQHGHQIKLAITPFESIAIDNPSDVERVLNMLKQKK